ncbi:MAG: right-handed parallel beta-helix repeat-containing protein, partial [Candidatus Thermoplasmatota archaeon]|nr:right-handed parallel beta-helix repeat-containing protein [Candidatus Thermoplasmatota archaeon]
MCIIGSCFFFSHSVDTCTATMFYVGGIGPGNYTSIQDAINASADGDTIQVYAGTYNECIVVNKSISLRGENLATTIINGSSNEYVVNVTADRVNISGFTINGTTVVYAIYVLGNYTNISSNSIFITNSERSCGIYVDSCNNNTISNNTIQSLQLLESHVDIYLWDSPNCTISNNTLNGNATATLTTTLNGNATNLSYGIYLYSCDYCAARNNTIGNHTIGLAASYSPYSTYADNTFFNDSIVFSDYYLDDIEHIVVESNTVNGQPLYCYLNNNTQQTVPSDAGAVILINCSNFTIQDNHQMSFVDSGIGVLVSQNISIINCSLTRSTFGIVIFSSDNITVDSCYLMNNSYVGINLGSSGNITLDSNYYYNNTYIGIYFSSSTNTTITSSEICSNHQSAGMYLVGSNCTVESNTIHNNSGTGIIVSGGGSNHITLNTIFNNSGDGMNLTYSDYNNVSYNSIFNNSLSGISLDNAEYNTVFENIISNNSCIGIETHHSSYRSSNNNSIVANTIRFNGDSGIELSGSECSNNTVLLNSIYNNSWMGVNLTTNSSYNTLMLNVIYDNSFGVFIDEANHNNVTTNFINNNSAAAVVMYSNSHNNSINQNFVYWNDAAGLILSGEADFNTIDTNFFYNNTLGIVLFYNSSENTITSNYVVYHDTGIHINSSCNSNDIYDNYFYSNTENVDLDGDSNNSWNTTRTLGTNVMTGPYLGGNYWDDYTGIDTDHDGIGDTLLPYTCSGEITTGGDYLPLVYSPQINTSSPTNGSTGVSISTNIIIIFYTAMNQTTVEGNLSISPSAAATCSWNDENTTLTINPSSNLQYTTTYTVTIGWNATDILGNVLTSNYSLIFTTADQPGGGGSPPSQPAANANPVADASAGEPYIGFVGVPVAFNGSLSYDTDGHLTNWTWTFGDNTTGSGEIVTHIYTTAGTFTVTLTVGDNASGTNTDSTVATILPASLAPAPPTKPTITGPITGHVNISYVYEVVSTDANNDTLQYTFTWGDGIVEYSEFLPNATPCIRNHSWSTAGKYTIIVTVTDNNTAVSSQKIIFIDAVDVGTIGYLLDTNGDGTYDVFHNGTTNLETTVQLDNGDYLVDADGDGTWDYTFNAASGLSSYTEEKGIPGFELLIMVIAITFIIVVYRKRRR